MSRALNSAPVFAARWQGGDEEPGYHSFWLCIFVILQFCIFVILQFCIFVILHFQTCLFFFWLMYSKWQLERWNSQVTIYSITLATGVHAKIRLDILTLFRFRIYYGLDIGFAEVDFADVVQNSIQLKIEHKINSRSQFERGPCFERWVGR